MLLNTVRAEALTFGVRIPPCRPVSEVAESVVAAEEAGFDIAWIPDSQFLWRDVWAAMTLAATCTSRIRLGTCVTNFETRHLSVTASAAATVAELAPGRLILGVGSGDSAVKTIGRLPTRLAEMRRNLERTRALLSGTTVEFEGRSMRLTATPKIPIPIYMAANGPKALGLAGEMCDGVLTLVGITPRQIESALEHVSLGADRAGRSIQDLDVSIGVHCQIGDSDQAHNRLTKPLIVAGSQTGAGPALRGLGIFVDPPPVAAGIYPDVGHAEDWSAAVDACEQWVSDSDAQIYADQFCALGTPEECVSKLSTAVGAGARSFYLRHFGSYTLPSELIDNFPLIASELASARRPVE